MSSPNLNRRLVLEHAVQTPDGAGGYSESWQALGTLWAKITAGTGSEKASQLTTVTCVPYKITVRAAPVGTPSRPKADQRFVEGARVYRIKAVTERDPQAHYLTCFAYEEEAS